MQKVDPAFLFEVGYNARGINRLAAGQDIFDSWLLLHAAQTAINECVYQSIYAHYFHSPLLVAASNLLKQIESLMIKLAPSEGDPQLLAASQVSSVKAAYVKFETILISELQSIASYIVTKKSGFDLVSMVDSGRVFFSEEIHAKVPNAIPDLDQAMKCIAFEVPTAAGFHLHRANESVLRVYWDSVTNNERRPRENNMGVYLRELNKLEKGNRLVRAHLQSIKDFHRNPLMHPEQSLDSVDQAIDLMSAIRCAIGYMLKEIAMPIASVPQVLSVDARE